MINKELILSPKKLNFLYGGTGQDNSPKITIHIGYLAGFITSCFVFQFQSHNHVLWAFLKLSYPPPLQSTAWLWQIWYNLHSMGQIITYSLGSKSVVMLSYVVRTMACSHSLAKRHIRTEKKNLIQKEENYPLELCFTHPKGHLWLPPDSDPSGSLTYTYL